MICVDAKNAKVPNRPRARLFPHCVVLGALGTQGILLRRGINVVNGGQIEIYVFVMQGFLMPESLGAAVIFGPSHHQRRPSKKPSPGRTGDGFDFARVTSRKRSPRWRMCGQCEAHAMRRTAACGRADGAACGGLPQPILSAMPGSAWPSRWLPALVRCWPLSGQGFRRRREMLDRHR